MPSHDIFISYARADAEAASRFASAFRAAGFDVWWDNSLQVGEIFDEAIETALRSAKAVVVLWSPESVASRWVRAEATLADRNKTLLPVLIAPCERPIVFEMTQTAMLAHWQGDDADAVWQGLLADARHLVGSSGQTSPGTVIATPHANVPGLRAVSIVVLPFANMSHDPEQDYFADGITEDIITDLSKVSALGVISRNSAFTFKGKNVDVPDVARQLNVTHVLEGSVRKAGNRVRVTAQLIDGSTNNHVWAERYDRDLDDIFALQDELSQAIVGALKVKLLPSEKKAIEDRGTDNVEAYDLYLQAQAMLSRRGHADVDMGVASCEAALALDPHFARAWRLLGAAHMRHAIYFPKTAQETLARAGEAYGQAMIYAPGSAEVQSARAAQLQLVDRDWIGADRANAEAEAIDGRAGLYSSFLFTSVGRITEAIEGYKEGVRTDPLLTNEMLQYTLDCARRHQESEAEFERVNKLNTSPVIGEYFSLQRLMAQDDREATRRQFKRYLSLKHDYLPFADALFTHFDAPDAALAILHAAFEDPYYRDSSRMSGIAHWAAFFGDDALALSALRIAYIEQRGVTIVTIWHPLFARARRTDAFKQLVRDLGLHDYWRMIGHWGDYARPLGDDDFEIIC